MEKVVAALEASRPVAQSTASSGAKVNRTNSSLLADVQQRQQVRSKSFARHLLSTAQSDDGAPQDGDDASSPASSSSSAGLEDHVCLLFVPPRCMRACLRACVQQHHDDDASCSFCFRRGWVATCIMFHVAFGDDFVSFLTVLQVRSGRCKYIPAAVEAVPEALQDVAVS